MLAYKNYLNQTVWAGVKMTKLQESSGNFALFLKIFLEGDCTAACHNPYSQKVTALTKYQHRHEYLSTAFAKKIMHLRSKDIKTRNTNTLCYIDYKIVYKHENYKFNSHNKGILRLKDIYNM